ncbi:MAG: hypothetical protein AB7R55_15175 [Gemmatimonadales bacterium]
MTRAGRSLAAGAVVLLAALGLVPLVNWIPSDLHAPWYVPVAQSWVLGGLLVLGIGLVVAILARRTRFGAPAGLAERLLGPFDPAGRLGLALVALGALALYLAIAWLVFDGRPLHIDEIVQLISARSYAAGRLSDPSDPDPAFRSLLHLVDHGGRTFGHFPPGGPAWLAPFELARAPWLAGPLAGALSVLAFGVVLRRIEPGRSVRAAAFLLFAFAPFGAFLAGSHMNHTPTLMWALVAVALALGTGSGSGVARWALVGLALGLAAATRPSDGLAWTAAVGLWAAFGREVDLRRGIALLVGLAIPATGVLAVNAATTGAPLTFAYELLWGSGVGLGFHPTPWGPPHTPLRGLELLNLYALRLNVYLFETPIPAMLPALLALGLARKLERGDALLLGSSALLLGVYFGYWHDGFYLGPRFVHGLLPALALWTARLPSVLRSRSGAGWAMAERVAVFGGLVALLIAILGLPERTRQYATGLRSLRWDVDRAAATAGIEDAVVLVQESWGAQLLARLWALGVPKGESERIYRNVDACRLEELVTGLERAGPGVDPLPPLVAAMADSARLEPTTLSPDRTERMLPGARYSSRCIGRLLEDQGGVTLLAPHLLSRREDLVFARNLHERNASLVARYPGRAVLLLYQPLDATVPRFRPLDRDSILAAGRATEPVAPPAP